MSDAWRLSDAADAVAPPDWAQPFTEADAAWQAGRAEGVSSGSTGAPKRFSFDPQAVVASARATAEHFGLSHPDGRPVHVWSALPATGIGGRMMVWRTRILGWALTQDRPASAPTVTPAPEGQRYDFAVATPQQAAHLARSGQLAAFRLLLLGGGPVSPALEAELLEAGRAQDCALHLGFGMTETLTHIATRPLGRDVFLPLPGVAWSCDPDGALRLNAPDRGVDHLLTRDAVEPRRDTLSGQDGFVWLGRLDDVINTGGLKVHPDRLERTLEPIVAPLISTRRWYLAGRPDPLTGMRVTLVVEGEVDPTLTDRLLDALATGHPHADRPRAVEWQPKLEETATGKVRRR